MLLCHLDFEDAPHPFARDTDFSQLPPSLLRAADVLASSLAPSVEAIGILERLGMSSGYLCFRVVRDDHGIARAESDRYVLERHGLSYVALLIIYTHELTHLLALSPCSKHDMSSLSRPDRF